jgi:hypothetical protein
MPGTRTGNGGAYTVNATTHDCHLFRSRHASPRISILLPILDVTQPL